MGDPLSFFLIKNEYSKCRNTLAQAKDISAGFRMYI